jgi:hypothetical protein
MARGGDVLADRGVLDVAAPDATGEAARPSIWRGRIDTAVSTRMFSAHSRM